MSSFIFVRHGQSQANADGIIAGAHSPLTEGGIAEARKTAGEVKDMGIKVVACSPYLRAQQTAEIIAGELGIELGNIRIIENLHERGLGVLENGPKEHDGTWYFLDEASEGIELRRALLGRMTRCLDEIAALRQEGVVLVVGHAISGFYLQQVAAGKTSLDDFDPPSKMGNADYAVVEFKV